MTMPDDAGATLTALARAAIAHELEQRTTAVPQSMWMTELGASFVTLAQEGHLRGCIGTLQAWRALGEDVAANAIAAATCDRRFHPLTRAELSRTDIEVSVLNTPEPLAHTGQADALGQLRPGIDGLMLSFGRHRGTFLPQVWQQLPDRRAFLNALKRKAGLPEDFWDDRMELSRYTVTAFAEP